MSKSWARSLTFDPSFSIWNGSIKLPALQKLRINPALCKTRPVPSVVIRVEADDEADLATVPLPQRKAIDFLLTNQARILAVLMKGLVAIAKEQQPIFAQFLPEKFLPKDATANQIKSRVCLQSITVTNRAKAGTAYIEYSFSSAWDAEHYLMVVLHKTRGVYSGGSGDGWADWME